MLTRVVLLVPVFEAAVWAFQRSQQLWVVHNKMKVLLLELMVGLL